MDIDALLYNFVEIKHYLDNYTEEQANTTIGNISFAAGGEGGTSSAVENVTVSLDGDDYERDELERFVNATMEVLESDKMKEFYNLAYYIGYDREEVQFKMGISRRTYYRKRKKLIDKINEKIKK